MADNPLVVCVMLANGREEMVWRAIKSFHSQTYERKALFVLDTGESELPIMNAHGVYSEYYPGLRIDKKTIGELRNTANGFTNPKCLNADIIAHWDSDDWSGPQRLTEQVALLQSSGADCVGYSDLLFWDTRNGHRTRMVGDTELTSHVAVNEAWLYTRPTKMCVPGTSLMYWRKTWEGKPFPSLPGRMEGAVPLGEDVVWQSGLKVEATTSIGPRVADDEFFYQPRMIASLHGSNTMAFGYSQMEHLQEYRKAPEWDSYCHRVMEIK